MHEDGEGKRILSRIALRGLLLLCFLTSLGLFGQSPDQISKSGIRQDQIYEQAVRLFQRRDLAGARQEFSTLVKLAPPAPKSRYYLGRIALLESKPAEAIAWLEPIAMADPPVFDAAAQLGQAYSKNGQLEKAKAAIERGLHQAPWDGSLHYRLGRIYQQSGDAERARQEFAETVRLKAEDSESVQLLLECSRHLAAGEKTEAMRVRSELLKNPSLDPDALVALGLEFTQAGLHTESLDAFQTAARRDPNFFQAQYNTGLALLKTGHPLDATGPLEKSCELATESVDANSALAVALVMQGRYAEAVAPLEFCHTREPDNARASTMLALAYLRTGRAQKSATLLQESLQKSQSDPKPYFLLIEALNAAERQHEALKPAEEVAERFPGVAQAHLAKAQQLARLGRYNDAGPEFARALQLTPDQIDSLLGMGEIQEKQGDYSASLETFEHALRIEPGNISAMLGAARNMILLGRMEDARRVLETAIEAHPEDSRAHYELSRVYARLGDRERAAEQTRIMQELRSRQTN